MHICFPFTAKEKFLHALSDAHGVMEQMGQLCDLAVDMKHENDQDDKQHVQGKYGHFRADTKP